MDLNISHGYKSFAHFPYMYFWTCLLPNSLISFNTFHSWTGKLGQCGSVFEGKTYPTTLVSGTHMVKGKNKLLQAVSWPLHPECTPTDTCMSHIYKQTHACLHTWILDKEIFFQISLLIFAKYLDI